MKTHKLRYPLDIQLFADENNDPGQSGTNIETDGGAEPKEPTTLKDLLATNKDFQSDFDKMVHKSIQTAKANWEKEYEEKLTQKISEAEKLAKMNKDEKDNYQRQLAEKQLQEREALITKRELMAQAKETLIEKGLSATLADVLNYESAETVAKSIESLKEVFEKAVQDQVALTMKQNAVPGRAINKSDSPDLEHWKKLSGIKTK